MSDRCYLRGTSPLGVFNTVIGCLFNRVLVQMRDVETGKVLGSYFDKATKHPPENDGELELRTRTSSIPKSVINTIRWVIRGIVVDLRCIASGKSPLLVKAREVAEVVLLFPSSVSFHYHQCRGPVYVDGVMNLVGGDDALSFWRRYRVFGGEMLDTLPNDLVMTERVG